MAAADLVMAGTGIDWAGRVVPYPAEEVARYRERDLWGDLTIPQEFREIRTRNPERLAVIAPDGRLTYAALDDAADLVALGLHRAGLMPGERILLQIYNSAQAAVAWYGVLKAGLIPVCTLPQHRHKEIGEIARQSQAAGHIVQDVYSAFDLVAFAREVAAAQPSLKTLIVANCDRRLPPSLLRFESLGDGEDLATARLLVDAIQAMIPPDEVAVFQLSGGTTSVPKIIPRLHAEYWYNAGAYAGAWRWTEADRPAHILPLVHNAGITCGLHAAHAAGAALVLSIADPMIAGPLLQEAEVTDMMVNSAVVNLAREHQGLRAALAGLKRLVWSGTKLSESVIEEFENGDTVIVQLFGMGEGLFTVTPPSATSAQRHRTVGWGLSDEDEVRIYQPGTEREAHLGEEGELCCRGPYTIRGYFDAADRNREAFTSDGFYRTGDLAKLEPVDGVICLSIEGRLKDVISRGGEKINAEEVELLVLRHPAVADAALVAMPDERLGERACLYVVCRGTTATLDLDELTKHLEQCGLAKFKWPERLELTDGLPRTSVGKLDKNALRADVAARIALESAPA